MMAPARSPASRSSAFLARRHSGFGSAPTAPADFCLPTIVAASIKNLLAHFHGLAPGLGGVDVKALKRQPVDIHHHEIRPLAFHYLRSTIETAGATGSPIVDELSLAASYLSAACALAAMNADAARTTVDRALFIAALTEASDVSHAQHPLLDWILSRFSSGTDALRTL
jgi:hypothetical protein